MTLAKRAALLLLLALAGCAPPCLYRGKLISKKDADDLRRAPAFFRAQGREAEAQAYEKDLSNNLSCEP